MKVFTTGQVAKICKVNPRTVSRHWYDRHLLTNCYRVPGSQDRRIPRTSLLTFLREHGRQRLKHLTPEALAAVIEEVEDMGIAKVLLLIPDQVFLERLKTGLTERAFKWNTADSGMEVRVLAEKFRPDAIVVDFGIGQVQALEICESIRSMEQGDRMIIVGLLPDDGSSLHIDRSSMNETCRKPVDAELLTERLRTMIGSHKALD